MAITLSLIIFIEFLVIIILLLAIKGYGKEKYEVRKQSIKYNDLIRNLTRERNSFLEKAQEVRNHVSHHMYRQMSKKNQIVKQACSQFYKELADRML